MRTLSNVDLELVTGGKNAPNPAASSSSATGTSTNSGDQALLTAMQGIAKQISELNNNNNKGLFGGNGGLFLIAALVMSQRRSYTEVHVGRRGYSYSYYA